MNAEVKLDQRIGRALAQFGTRVAIAHWNGRNESIRPLSPQERMQQWFDRYHVFTHQFGQRTELAAND